MDQRYDERGSSVRTRYDIVGLSIENIKSEFPIFDESDLIYLDNASTTQKPRTVIDSVQAMYTQSNANVHRAIYDLGSKATEQYENSRTKVTNFIFCFSEFGLVYLS